MPLSIGLEFEVVVLSLKPVAEIPRSTQAQFQLIANAISSTGAVASPYMPTSPRDSPNYTIWNVVVDSTVQEVTSHSDASDSAYQSRFGVELVTPTYYETDKTGWKDNVHLALGGVDERVSWKANRSTGLHVHVGRGRDKTFTLPQLKRLAMLVCRFEEAIDTLHPVHRILDNENILSNRFNPMLKDLTLVEVYSRILGIADVVGLSALLNYVGGSGSNHEVYDGYHDSKFYKVNFSSLAKHSTVEFRQHEGTVSAKSAINWAEFVIRFVEYAMDASDNAIMTGGNTIDDLAHLVRLP